MGRWMIWVKGKNDRRIGGMDSRDGSAEAINRGEIGVTWSLWIFSGRIGRSSGDETAQTYNGRGGLVGR